MGIEIKERSLVTLADIFNNYKIFVSAFKVIEGTHAFGQKFVFFLGQLVNIALALYKCQSMGLLPTHASDWLAFVEPQARLEYSGGGLIF